MTFLREKCLKFVLTFFFFVGGYSVLMAKSTVFLFIPGLVGSDVELRVDGEFISKVETPVKKHYEFDDGNWDITKPGWVKIEFEKSEKIILSLYNFFETTVKKEFMAEIQLNLFEDSTDYIEYKFKGMNDFKIVRIDEKSALKKMKNKKICPLPDIIVK